MNVVIVRAAGRLMLWCAIAAITAESAAANVAPRYIATPVGPLPVGAHYLDPADINDAGHIVGLAPLAANTRGFFTDGAKSTTSWSQIASHSARHLRCSTVSTAATANGNRYFNGQGHSGRSL